MAQPLIHITRKQAFKFAAFLVLYQFLTYIANDMIMPGMIHVVHSFQAPESSIASSLTAYVLGGASLQLFLGPLSDCYGRRPVMLAGTCLFLVFTLFIACSSSIDQFLLSRYFQGMGLCFTTVVGYAVIQEMFAEMDAIRITSFLTNVAALAPLLGPLAGAIYILYFPWQGIFILIGLLALVALCGLWRCMPETIGVLKKDGERIASIPLTPKVVAKNYYKLLSNPAFMAGAITSGILNIPCMAWIALSPIIIVTNAHLSVIDYALWQLPIFGAGILGNWYLRHLTHHSTVKKMIFKGSTISVIGMALAWLIPFSANTQFFYLMPGLIIYGFGLGMTAAPLCRYLLFSTNISKGTAYAVLSIVNMGAEAVGIEVANHVYAQHNNGHFGLYCFLLGFLYLLGLGSIFFFQKASGKELDTEPEFT